MQARAGGIQEQLRPVVHQGELKLILGAGFRQPGYAVFFSQPSGSGLFHNGLAVRNAHKGAVQAVALYREGAVLGNIGFQRGIVNPLEQFFKGCGPEIRQDDEHPLAGAQAHIGLGQGPLVAGEQHPAVFHADVVHVQPPQLVSRQALQAKETGDGKFHLIHIHSRFLSGNDLAFLQIPLFLGEHAAAVLLDVEAQLSGLFLPRTEIGAEIPV